MSEEKLSSHKLDIEGAQRLSAGEETLKESYRPISEDIGLTHGKLSLSDRLVMLELSSEHDWREHKLFLSLKRSSTKISIQNVDPKNSLLFFLFSVRFVPHDKKFFDIKNVLMQDSRKYFSCCRAKKIFFYRKTCSSGNDLKIARN